MPSRIAFCRTTSHVNCWNPIPLPTLYNVAGKCSSHGCRVAVLSLTQSQLSHFIESFLQRLGQVGGVFYHSSCMPGPAKMLSLYRRATIVSIQSDMESRSPPVDFIEPDYTVDGEPLSDSHLKDLSLHTRVCGVRYHRDIDGKAAATVLLEITFSIPQNAEMSQYDTPPTFQSPSDMPISPPAYAKLPFRGVPAETVDPNQSLRLMVNALTPGGEQIVCLGVRRVDSTTSIQPSLNLNVGAVGFGMSGLGCVDSTTKEFHQHIELIGYCGVQDTSSHWEFKNDRRARYPRKVFLLIEFSSNHGTDEPFPFVLRFSSSCQVKLSRSWYLGGDKFIGKPSQKLDIAIKGNWRRKEVLKHMQSADTGIIAAVEKLRKAVSACRHGVLTPHKPHTLGSRLILLRNSCDLVTSSRLLKPSMVNGRRICTLTVFCFRQLFSLFS